MEQSSFTYRQWVGGNTLMVIVPHEDDEMNMAGATIYGAKQEGLRVIIVFITNGDYEYRSSIRFNDTYRMAREMGIPQEDIIFLGFPDHVMNDISNPSHLYADGFGITYTHGDGIVQDFSTQYEGEPKSYTYESLIQVIYDVIVANTPHMIIATDYDTHRDHRLCSLAVDKAVSLLVTEQSEYKPKLLKAFAYATGYETIDDYYNNHLISTVVNKKAINSVGNSTGNPILVWNHRLRIPVPYDCRDMNLVDNPIFKGMAAHASQEGYKRGSRLINGDQVFWERFVYNLAREAVVTVSSGDGTYINDGIWFYQEHLNNEIIDASKFMWMPSDSQPTVRFTFSTSKTIAYIVLYTSDVLRNYESESDFNTRSIQEVLIRTEDRSDSFCSDDVEYCDGIIRIIFNQPVHTAWLELKITKYVDTFSGLSEIELHESVPIDTYCHILGNNQFMYDWVIFPGESIPHIDLYTDGFTSRNRIQKDYTWFINGQLTSQMDMQHVLRNVLRQGPVLLRVEHNRQPIWCEITMRKGTCIELMRKKWSNLVNRYRYLRVKRYYKSLYRDAQSYKYKEGM